MKWFFPSLSLIAAMFFGCKTEVSSRPGIAAPESRLKGIYMDRISNGDSGWPESELFLGCDHSIIGEVKLLDTVQINAAVRIFIPCEVLNEISDSLDAIDSLPDSPKDNSLWICHRFTNSDTGLVETKKNLAFGFGKAKVWWMMDFILARSPMSFKGAMKGQWPFPNRASPPDSAWLDTVKQGLF